MIYITSSVYKISDPIDVKELPNVTAHFDKYYKILKNNLINW